jgi:hypothetical protein
LMAIQLRRLICLSSLHWSIVAEVSLTMFKLQWFNEKSSTVFTTRDGGAATQQRLHIKPHHEVPWEACRQSWVSWMGKLLWVWGGLCITSCVHSLFLSPYYHV